MEEILKNINNFSNEQIKGFISVGVIDVEDVIDVLQDYDAVQIACFIKKGLIQPEDMEKNNEVNFKTRKKVKELLEREEEQPVEDDDSDFEKAKELNIPEAFQDYLDSHPDGKHREEARALKRKVTPQPIVSTPKWRSKYDKPIEDEIRELVMSDNTATVIANKIENYLTNGNISMNTLVGLINQDKNLFSKEVIRMLFNKGIFKKATLTVKSPKHINDDPIEGYYREYDNSDELKYDSWSFLNHWFFRLLMAGALILGGVGGYLVSGWINSRSAKQNTTVTTQTTPNQNGENVQQLSPSDGGASTGAAETVTAPEKPAQNEAVEYLDNNDVWNKDKMDQIAELKGFWDLVNDYDINKIKEQPWKDRLSESKTYNEIINTFGNKKTSDFRTNRPHNKRTDDYDINVKRYIKAIKGYSGNSNAQPQEGSSTPKKEHPTTTTTNSTNNQSTNQSAGTNEENL